MMIENCPPNPPNTLRTAPGLYTTTIPKLHPRCYISNITQGCTSSGGKVRFSSAQRTISPNLELNSRFGSGHSAEP